MIQANLLNTIVVTRVIFSLDEAECKPILAFYLYPLDFTYYADNEY